MSDVPPAKVRRTNAQYTAKMDSEHFDQLGDYCDPEEAQDLEETVQGFEDWEDLPQEDRDHLLGVARSLYEFLTKTPGSLPTQLEFDKAYQKFCGVRRKRGGGFARKSQILTAYRQLVAGGEVPNSTDLPEYLLKKRTKSHSGVLVITVVMGPGKFSCPKDCHYCPNQPGIARSYLLREPGILRGYRNGWDPIRQFNDRARALENNGHIVDKIEIIILGGTFSFYPKDYARDFIRALYYAANTFYEPGGRPQLSLAEEITLNEGAACRIIGLTVETRPDYITNIELHRFRELGVTRVQIGIQHIDDQILDYVNRECSTEKAKQAVTRLLNAGFKVDAHWMPDLPGSSYEKDMAMFEYLLGPNNKDLQVDQWKVYPTAVVPFTKIKEWYDNGTYVPYAQKDNGKWMVDLICYVMVHAPYRIRLNRIVRDIPSDYIVAGENRTNLRQEIDSMMKRKCLRCKDIRERECKGKALTLSDSMLHIDQFEASGGTEYYFSVEDKERTTLYGHLRLRINANIHDNTFDELKGCALIRELHTYGKLVAVSTQNSGKETQHVGVGKRLMATAESIATRHGCPRIAVIAGVGVRNYYRKLGYKLKGTYLVKDLEVETTAEPGVGGLRGAVRKMWSYATSILHR
jgi:ELP3 family radical SAM enzyme/protein acetyltransferase